ncbi:phage antirepressor N-terminal domain-containing protein [Corynebacterium pseudodiphtheriticum]|uniref:phage antirepressor N-terminal domain-containing protein n=1 Tax=Corynebacterium pseudodiphtheriticum TaxID=37637 RepID=UPI00234D2F6D|nr:phage antirepressor N-terminal domain-containing protein [Corynebacterium pseudodiphtheriticum]MDC7087812.1 phage antirepressor N-terminal domain-containing protein [Corynebacterium pseudodiphtheriticum]
MNSQLVTIPVPGTSNPIMAVQYDGTEWVAARHICDALGIEWGAQRNKLKGKLWATVSLIDTVGADGKKREMSMVDRRTLTMWLATIDTNRVSEAARPTLEAYQLEAANALDAYFHNGGAINPRAKEHQLNALMRQSQMQMELCQAAKGLIHPDHLEARARIVLARGLGEAPELNPETRPLYTADFLKSKNLSTKKMKSVAPMFGKRMKALYTLEKGSEPEKYDLTLPNGQVRQVNGYTEADRPLMQKIWDQYYATK